MIFCVFPGPQIPTDVFYEMTNVSPVCQTGLVQMTTLPTQDAIQSLGIVPVVCKQTDASGGIVIYGNGPTSQRFCQVMGLPADGGALDDMLNGR